MSDVFDVVGENFFRPLTGQYRNIYYQCLRIIYNSYRTELSYGIERELLVRKLTTYFVGLNIEEFRFEDETEENTDSRHTAGMFLRRLKQYGWIDSDIGPDRKTMIMMPGYAVSVFRNLETVASGRETEYRSELYAIYSLLTKPEPQDDPYSQIVKPVYDRTEELFTALKQLNTDIKKYIDRMTSEKTAEEIVRNFFEYNEEVGSRAYHRLYTSDNVHRYRNVIRTELTKLRDDRELAERTAWGYRVIEGETDPETAKERTREILNGIISHFGSYDEIVGEIEKKHARYLRNTVKRAQFLLLNTNNTEGKISTILRYLASQTGDNGISAEEMTDDFDRMFDIYSQCFVGPESVKKPSAARSNLSAAQIVIPPALTDEQRNAYMQAIYEKNRNRFSRKNITEYVGGLLKDTGSVMASSIKTENRRDMIRIIYIRLYGQSPGASYQVIPTDRYVCRDEFRFRDFEIRRKKK